MLQKTFHEGYCKTRVHHAGRSVTFHQCRLKAVRDGYCGIHHPEAQAARRKKAEQRYADRLRRDPLQVALRRVRALEKEVRRLKRLRAR